MLAPDYVFRGHSHSVNCIKVFPIQSQSYNCLAIISGDSGGNIFLWNLKSKKCVKQFVAHDDSVISVHAFSATETISSSKDGSIKIWDINTSAIPLIELFTGAVGFSNIAIDSNCSSTERLGSAILSPSSVTTDILLWDVRKNPKTPSATINTKSGQIGGSGNTNHGMITALQFHSNLQRTISSTSNGAAPIVLSGFEDGSLSCFDLRNPVRPLYTVTHHTEPLLAIDISPVSSSIITGGADSLVNFYASYGYSEGNLSSSCGSRRGGGSSSGSGNDSSSSAGSGSGGASSGGGSGDGSSSSSSSSSNSDANGGVGSVGSSNIERPVWEDSVLTSENACIMLDPTSTPMPTRQQSLRSAGTGALRFRSDGRVVASAHWDGTVRLWDSRSTKSKSLLKPLAVLRHHREAVFAVDFAGRAPFYIPPPGDGDSKDNNGNSNTTTTSKGEGVGVEACKEESFGVFVTASKDGTIAVWSTLAREGGT